MKKLLSLFLTLFLASQAGAQDATIKILCVNDMHAAIDNMPKLAYVVDSIRQQCPDAILMAAGDNRTGNPFNDKCSQPNKPMVDLMNLIGFDMSTMGNHECDGGVESFVRNINDSYFPYVVANVYPADSLKMHISPFRLFQRNGVRIGVLGLVEVNERGIPDCHPNLVKGIKFTSPFEKAEELGSLMADGMRVTLNTDFCIVNAGGVRYSTKEAGDITVYDILKLDPFDNEMMIAKLTGHQIAQALAELSLVDGYGPGYVSGLTYQIEPDKKDSSKNAVKIYDEAWKPIDMDKTYTVTMNSYIAAITPTIRDANPENTFAIATDQLMKYLEDQKTVDYKGTKRVKIDLPNWKD